MKAWLILLTLGLGLALAQDAAPAAEDGEAVAAAETEAENEDAGMAPEEASDHASNKMALKSWLNKLKDVRAKLSAKGGDLKAKLKEAVESLPKPEELKAKFKAGMESMKSKLRALKAKFGKGDGGEAEEEAAPATDRRKRQAAVADFAGDDDDEDEFDLVKQVEAIKQDIAEKREKRANNLDCRKNDGKLWDRVVYWDDCEIYRKSYGYQAQAAQCAMDAFAQKLGSVFTFRKARCQCKSDSSKKKNCMYFKDTPKHSPRSCNGHSHVGRSKVQPHEVFFSECSDMNILCGIMQHELFHAFGVNHEQCRVDRDKYVSIDFRYVVDGMEHNFNKVDPKEADNTSPYDFNSIMHYGGKTFSKDGVHTTINTRDRRYQNLIGEALTLSNTDVEGIKRMYSGTCQITSCLVPKADGSFDEIAIGQKVSKGDRIFTQHFRNDIRLAYCCQKTNTFSFYHSTPCGVNVDGSFKANGAQVTTLKSPSGGNYAPLCFNINENADGSTSYGVGGC